MDCTLGFVGAAATAPLRNTFFKSATTTISNHKITLPCAASKNNKRVSITRRNQTADGDNNGAAPLGEDGLSPEEKRRKREEAAREREERIRLQRAERQAKLKEMDMETANAPTFAQLRAAQQEQEKAQEEYKDKQNQMLISEDGTYGANATGLFGWVNNNESSKNAVYIENFKGNGGNVGEMMRAIRGKGRTNDGSDVNVVNPLDPAKKLRMYVRKMGAESSRPNRSPIVCVHGVLANSWTFRDFMVKMAMAGYELYAADWLGCGYSEWPQPGYGYNFKEETFMKTFENYLTAIGLGERKFTLVCQGYAWNQFAAKWALKNPERVSEIVFFNGPLMPDTKLPFVLQQYKIPMVKSFVAQDAMRSERFLEGGGPYVMSLQDAERYRESFLDSMMPGLAVVDTMDRCDFSKLQKEIYTLSKESKIPVHVVWGVGDKYHPISEAVRFCEETGAKLIKIEGAGFVVQNDWPEKCVDALKTFLL